MINHAAVIHKGGLGLWNYTLKQKDRKTEEAINTVIRKVIMENKKDNEYKIEKNIVKWKHQHEHSLLFVIMYSELVEVSYVDDLLKIMTNYFCKKYQTILKESDDASICEANFDEFTPSFRKILTKCEDHAEKQRQEKGKTSSDFDLDREKTPEKSRPQNTFLNITPSRRTSRLASPLSPSKADRYSSPIKDKKFKRGEGSSKSSFSKQSQSERIKERQAALRKATQKGNKHNKKNNNNALTTTQNNNKSSKPKKQKSKKRGTKWNEFEYNAEEAERLDCSKPQEGSNIDAMVAQYKKEFLPNGEKDIDIDNVDDLDAEFDFEKELAAVKNQDQEQEQEQEAKITNEPKSATRSFFGSLYSTLVGGKLTAESIREPMQKMYNLLLEKNVAETTAREILDSVESEMLQKEKSSFESVASLVRDAMGRKLESILNKNYEMDILSAIKRAKEEGRPFKICMTGVNGVGKSTSLAKIVYWLKKNKMKVLIAAGDTFRSGAVEQLEAHAKCLNCELYQKSYGLHPAQLAKEAIAEAQRRQMDVVMIDTAGRMQNDKNLMKELKKVITQNMPDLTLFVAEALVGNDGVDQLVKFNKALTKENKPLINGIVLTKYDTIDDKVGSAINMCQSTGHPILFIGTGQTYTDLKRLKPTMVVNQLLR